MSTNNRGWTSKWCLGLSNVYISYIETGVKGISLEVLLKIVDEFGLSLDSLVLDDSFSRLPKIYRDFGELLADCDIEECDRILKIARDFKKMMKEERK